MVEESDGLEEDGIKVLVRDRDHRVYREARTHGLTDLQARIAAGRAGGKPGEDWASLIT